MKSPKQETKALVETGAKLNPHTQGADLVNWRETCSPDTALVALDVGPVIETPGSRNHKQTQAGAALALRVSRGRRFGMRHTLAVLSALALAIRLSSGDTDNALMSLSWAATAPMVRRV